MVIKHLDRPFMQRQRTHLLKLLITALLLFPAGMAFAQAGCKVKISENRVCIGNTVTFSVTYSSTMTPTSFVWKFGDNTSDINQTVIHKYASLGLYIAEVTVSFPDGSKCVAYSDKITVVPLPVADFQLMSSKEQCLTGNSFCFQDNSAPLPGQAAIVNRTIDYGDGSVDNTTPVTVKTLCHTYATPGVYTIILEVSDANGCVSRVIQEKLVAVKAKMSVSFTTSVQSFCGRTTVGFKNTTPLNFSEVKSFKWIFGDGKTDVKNWVDPVHTFTGAGTYNTVLLVTSKYGCTDSFETTINVKAFDQPFNIIHDKDHACFDGNYFSFTR
jgi:PKD repeat protein